MAIIKANVIPKGEGRPSKVEQDLLRKRDIHLVKMLDDGYPRDYIMSYFNLSKGQVSKIIKATKRKSEIARKES
jgi:uncharacterized protein involved in high-affinity Fe2+ transport